MLAKLSRAGFWGWDQLGENPALSLEVHNSTIYIFQFCSSILSSYSAIFAMLFSQKNLSRLHLQRKREDIFL